MTDYSLNNAITSIANSIDKLAQAWNEENAIRRNASSYNQNYYLEERKTAAIEAVVKILDSLSLDVLSSAAKKSAIAAVNNMNGVSNESEGVH